jgi:hypothetical protein
MRVIVSYPAEYLSLSVETNFIRLSTQLRSRGRKLPSHLTGLFGVANCTLVNRHQFRLPLVLSL